MTIKDLNQQAHFKNHMVFVEFLEYVCRVVYIAHFSKTLTEDLRESSGDNCVSEHSKDDAEQSYKIFLFTKRKEECSEKYLKELDTFIQMC